MSSTFNPKLAISCYFDSLIRLVDIITEEHLEEHAEYHDYELSFENDHVTTNTSPNSKKKQIQDLSQIDFHSVKDISILLHKNEEVFLQPSRSRNSSELDFDSNLFESAQQKKIKLRDAARGNDW